MVIARRLLPCRRRPPSCTSQSFGQWSLTGGKTTTHARTRQMYLACSSNALKSDVAQLFPPTRCRQEAGHFFAEVTFCLDFDLGAATGFCLDLGAGVFVFGAGVAAGCFATGFGAGAFFFGGSGFGAVAV